MQVCKYIAALTFICIMASCRERAHESAALADKTTSSPQLQCTPRVIANFLTLGLDWFNGKTLFAKKQVVPGGDIQTISEKVTLEMSKFPTETDFTFQGNAKDDKGQGAWVDFKVTAARGAQTESVTPSFYLKKNELFVISLGRIEGVELDIIDPERGTFLGVEIHCTYR